MLKQALTFNYFLSIKCFSMDTSKISSKLIFHIVKKSLTLKKISASTDVVNAPDEQWLNVASLH